MAGKRKEKVKTKLTLTYLFLIFLAVISILPFYSMIIGCTHDNAALATSFQLVPGKYLAANFERLNSNVNIFITSHISFSWRYYWYNIFSFL